jgi:hypothetical protein
VTKHAKKKDERKKRNYFLLKNSAPDLVGAPNR